MSASPSAENEDSQFGTPHEVLLGRYGLDIPEAADLDISVLVMKPEFGDYYWRPEVQRLRECGFDRDLLKCLAALDKRIIHGLVDLHQDLEEQYGDVTHLGDFLLQTPDQIPDGLFCRDALRGRSLLQAFIDLQLGRNEDYVDRFYDGDNPLTFDDFETHLHIAYDPDNRLLMKPFEGGVDEEGVIHDAAGLFSSHRGLLVDQYGGLHELKVRPKDPFS